MAVLECKGLACAYDGKLVIKGVTFAIGAGETVALLGPNGSGKSTLLKACSKTHPYRAGSLRLGADEITNLEHQEVARRASFVPQEEPATFPFKVRDVVAMGRLSLSKGLFDTPEDIKAAEDAMNFTDCLELAERPMTQLSGGERQRVLIARAVAQGAPLMLLDEPTSHLDVGHQLALIKLLRNMASSGTALLTAIHDLNTAPLLADRAILLRDGGIALDGSVEEILRSPSLDETYGVEFQRIEMPSGRLLVIPR
ncbi:MAG: ABC transporter ATP-binding protein [Fimbriimonas sp.]